MKIVIGSDHSGFELKGILIEYLKELGYEVEDFGTNSKEFSKYPIYGEKVGKAVANKDYDRGIIICGSGVGISIAANKVKGVRAVVCSEPFTAKLSKEHSDTNVLALGAEVVTKGLAKLIVKEWLEAEFDGGEYVMKFLR